MLDVHNADDRAAVRTCGQTKVVDQMSGCEMRQIDDRKQKSKNRRAQGSHREIKGG